MERLKNLNTSLRRSVFELLLIAAIIQLLDLTAISEFQLGPTQLSDLTLVHKFLPVVAAYLIYDIVVTVLRSAHAGGISTSPWPVRHVGRPRRRLAVGGPGVRPRARGCNG